MSENRINVTKPSMPPLEEYIEEIRSIWDNRWLTHHGPKHQHLESELCQYLNVDHVSIFINGHMALEAAINIWNLSGEVITTPYTYASTTQAIVRCGLTPVFCDIKPDDYTMDPDKIEALITEKTCAIVPVHVYGNICDYKKINEIAQKHNLKVLYDAAHAFGMSVDGTPVGQLGDMSMFSFHATKVYHTVEGGCLTFNGNDAWSEDLRAWRMYGMYPKVNEDCEIIGTNAKMTEIHAAMGLCNLRHIDEYIENRKLAVLRYREHLTGIAGLTLCEEKPGTLYNYAYFPVVFDEKIFGKSRDQVCDELAADNIIARKYFYPLTSSFTAYKGAFEIQSTPIAEKVSTNVLTLPLYSDLSLKDVDRICSIILS